VISDLVSFDDAGSGAVGPADADEIPQLRGDAAAPGVAVDGDRDSGPLSAIECIDDLGGHLGARCVPGDDPGAEGLGVHRPRR
jgi:hypothetical protein